jgi:hypothetical protein
MDAPSTDDVCKEISGELIAMVDCLSEGGLNPEQFRNTVAALEARKLARFGFRLTSAVDPDGVVQFSLRYASNGDLCASLEADPKTGELTAQHTCT